MRVRRLQAISGANTIYLQMRSKALQNRRLFLSSKGHYRTRNSAYKRL